MIKVIDSIQYHVWSDALHARELARQTQNEWDRGAYVRWAIQTAWSAFENVCTDTLKASGLGMRFKERFDEAVDALGLQRVNWGQGIWQQVLGVYTTRKTFAHVVPTISHQTLLSSISDAENAISVIRDGIKAVLDLAGHPHPAWVNDDNDRGWYGPRGAGGSMAFMTVVRAGADENDDQVIRIAYVLKGKEHICEISPPGANYRALLDQLITNLNVPVEKIRAYRGQKMIVEESPNIR